MHAQAAQVPQPPPQPQQQYQPPMFNPGVPDHTNLSAMLANMGQFGMPPAPNYQYPYQQNPAQYPQDDMDRKRYREGDYDDRDGDANKRQKHSKKGRSQSGRPVSLFTVVGVKCSRTDLSANSPQQFVVQCRFWKEGACKKGDDCTFLHE